MKKFTSIVFGTGLLLLSASFTASAASGGNLEHSGANINDIASLQRGAKWFVNYCLGCHSASYMRYNRLAEDLDLGEDLVMQNLVFADAKIGDTMDVSMDAEQAEGWFGKTPPDLSLIGRARSADWLYSYLRGFYMDSNGAWNNSVMPDVAMPHVLWRLQGIQIPVYHQEMTDSGILNETIDHFEIRVPGTQTPEEFDQTARDIAAFLDYLGEPAKLKRKKVGVWVLLFITVFALLAYLLKAEYWRDVH